MKHARADYNRIQDPEHKIPPDEPVFLIRAQDKVGPATVFYWAAAAREAGASKQIIDAALKQVDAMYDWQKEHGSKIPDM